MEIILKFDPDEMKIMSDDVREKVEEGLHPILATLEAKLEELGILGALTLQVEVSDATPEEAGGREDLSKIIMGRFIFDGGKPDGNPPGPLMYAVWALQHGLVDPMQVMALAEHSKVDPDQLIQGLDAMVGGLSPGQRTKLEQKLSGMFRGQRPGRRPPARDRKPREWTPIKDDDDNVIGFEDAETGERDMLN